MGTLTYSAITSLDGYVADDDGNFDWAAPDEELHRFVNDQERSIGTYLYGRRMYDVMKFWEDPLEDQPDHIRDYGEIWRAADKVVFSSSLEAAPTARTTIERTFDADAVCRMKEHSDAELSIGGPHLAAQALAAGLVDECHFFVHPVVVGSGNSAFPRDRLIRLELLDERRFGSGAIHLHYRLSS